MAAIRHAIAVGVFADRRTAEAAVQALLRFGFRSRHIGTFTEIGSSAAAAAASLTDALIGLGITPQEARFYQRLVQKGRCLVTVNAGNHFGPALETLRRHGAIGFETSAAMASAILAAPPTEAAEPRQSA